MNQLMSGRSLKWKMDSSQFSKLRFFSVDPKAREAIRIFDDESKRAWKEMGGVGCYSFDEKKDKITLKNLIEIRPNELHSDYYTWNPNSMRDTSDVYCGNRKPLVFHTHPNGALQPSEQDRIISADSDHVGCVISRGDVACYFGENDLYPLN